jgi:hypothetical protein
MSLCRIGMPRQDVSKSSTVKEARLQTKIVGFTLRLLLLRRVTLLPKYVAELIIDKIVLGL